MPVSKGMRTKGRITNVWSDLGSLNYFLRKKTKKFTLKIKNFKVKTIQYTSTHIA